MKKLLLCLLIVGGASVFAQAPAAAAPVVAVQKVSYQQEEEVRRYTGRIESPSTVMVVPRVSGEIIEVGFADGAMVKKGQVLYKLDPVQYYAALKACEARVVQCKAQITQSEAAIQECRARETYAQHDFARNSDLYQKTVVSKDTLEAKQSALDVAKAATVAASAKLEGARAALLEAEANLITAQDNYKNTTIVAPMDALAGVTNKTVGNYITPATGTLVTLIQMNPMRVRFPLSYNDYLTFREKTGTAGSKWTLRMRLANGKFYQEDGQLELMDNEANKSTDAIALYAKFNNKDNVLYAGGTVAIYLWYVSAKKSLAVLPSCLMHDSEGSYVYVVDAENKIARRDVEVGLATTNWQFILDGLKEGERVVTDGMQKIMPGVTTVNPVEASTTLSK